MNRMRSTLPRSTRWDRKSCTSFLVCLRIRRVIENGTSTGEEWN